MLSQAVIMENINSTSIFSLLLFEQGYLCTYVIDLEFSVCIPNIWPEGIVSKICYLGPSFCFT